MLTAYIRVAMRKARYEILPNGEEGIGRAVCEKLKKQQK